MLSILDGGRATIVPIALELQYYAQKYLGSTQDVVLFGFGANRMLDHIFHATGTIKPPPNIC